MIWHHIMDRQPEHGASIIQVDAPYEGHYTMGMRNYCQLCTWDEFLKYRKNNNLNDPNFWWMYSADFPFPDKI